MLSKDKYWPWRSVNEATLSISIAWQRYPANGAKLERPCFQPGDRDVNIVGHVVVG